MSKRPKPRPHLPHRFRIDRLKRQKRPQLKIKNPPAPLPCPPKFLIPNQNRAGDDTSPKLKQHHRPRPRIQPRRPIPPPPPTLRQQPPKIPLLNLFNRPPTKPRDLIAHRQNSDCRDFLGHGQDSKRRVLTWMHRMDRMKFGSSFLSDPVHPVYPCSNLALDSAGRHDPTCIPIDEGAYNSAYSRHFHGQAERKSGQTWMEKIVRFSHFTQRRRA